MLSRPYEDKALYDMSYRASAVVYACDFAIDPSPTFCCGNLLTHSASQPYHKLRSQYDRRPGAMRGRLHFFRSTATDTCQVQSIACTEALLRSRSGVCMQSYASATAANVKDNDQGAQPAQLDAPSAGGTGGQPVYHCLLIDPVTCLGETVNCVHLQLASADQQAWGPAVTAGVMLSL